EFFGPGEEADPLHSGRIVGVYHRVGGIAARAWRQLVRAALDAATPMPAAASLPGEEILKALRVVHFPERQEDADGARARLGREERGAGGAHGADRDPRGTARREPRLLDREGRRAPRPADRESARAGPEGPARGAGRGRARRPRRNPRADRGPGPVPAARPRR